MHPKRPGSFGAMCRHVDNSTSRPARRCESPPGPGSRGVREPGPDVDQMTRRAWLKPRTELTGTMETGLP
jgi:hypothetical protein